MAPCPSSKGGTVVPISTGISPSEFLDTWPAVCSFFEDLSGTSPNYVTTLLVRLPVKAAGAGVIETDNGSEKARLTRLEVDARDWHVNIFSWIQPLPSDPALQIPAMRYIRHWNEWRCIHLFSCY